MNGEVLFLAHRMPFPPDRGDKIRSHHILRRLCDIAPVHVATFADGDADMAHEQELADLAQSHCLVRRKRPLWRAGLEALAAREPVSLAAFRDERIAAYVRDLLARRPIRAIYVFSGQMGQYVPDHFTGRVVTDLVDVDSAKFEAYGHGKLSPQGYINTREGRLLRCEEERLAHRADITLFVSEAEAELFRSRLRDPAGVAVSVLRNGINSDYFDPAIVQASPAISRSRKPQVVFTGQMDYAPNVAAAERLLTRIMPALQQTHPQAQCHIVGRNPPAALHSHDRRNGCRIWGEVADVRPFIAAADMVMVPLAIARGVQNKVLEAMAMARPVVLTPEAANGIDGRDGVHFSVEHDDDGLVARARELAENPAAGAAMGLAARQFVVETLGWGAVLEPLHEIVFGRGGDCRNAA